MVMGKHVLVRKPRMVGILFMLLGICVVLSFFLVYNAFSRRHRLQFDTEHTYDTGLKNRYQVIDPTLRGLLLPPSQYENGKCVSRLEETLIRRPSPYEPSPYLITKLRKYEDRHRRCASKAKKFNKDGPNSNKILGDCQFVVWIANSGLGNRMITIVSAFVYALLTDRVLLLDHSGTDIGGLFCEPFPSSSWLLPEGYDYAWMNTLIWENTNRLGHLLQMSEGGVENVTDVPPNNYVFLNLMHDYDDHDKRFFCKKVQKYLKKVPLLYFRSNNYVVPGYHFVEDFHVELDKMFPERETTFHHMIRYLFRPSNLMWGLILRFRQPYLAGAERQVGLQVRILESNVTMPVVADQLLKCVLERGLLPNSTASSDDHLQSGKEGATAVVITSLDAIYYEKFREFYSDQATEGGHYIGVYSPSKEEYQQYGFSHDKKAWADIFLLSLSDTLVTSPWSTFGYIAQALGGVTPWILTKSPTLETAEETFQAQGHCNLGLSLEPCFHSPPDLNCGALGQGVDPSTILPFIRPCEDVIGGVKIMPRAAETPISEEHNVTTAVGTT